MLRNESYNGSHSLAIPKLNLQYLTVGDFLWRSFILYRCEAFFEIRKHLEEAIKRIEPRSRPTTNAIQFDGFSRMALPISKPRCVLVTDVGNDFLTFSFSIVEVAPPKVGFDEPAHVRAEIALDVGRLADNIRTEWDSLRPDDVVYLLAVKPYGDSTLMLNGNSEAARLRDSGLLYLRTADVVQILDENGRTLREPEISQANGHTQRPRLRRLIVNMDALAYKGDEDQKLKGKPDIYDSINVIVRRKGRENNFKRILESIKSLTLSDVPVPAWFQEVFLGYGDPAGATYAHLPNRLRTLDFRDTFLDWQHLKESLPNKVCRLRSRVRCEICC